MNDVRLILSESSSLIAREIGKSIIFTSNLKSIILSVKVHDMWLSLIEYLVLMVRGVGKLNESFFLLIFFINLSTYFLSNVKDIIFLDYF